MTTMMRQRHYDDDEGEGSSWNSCSKRGALLIPVLVSILLLFDCCLFVVLFLLFSSAYSLYYRTAARRCDLQPWCGLVGGHIGTPSRFHHSMSSVWLVEGHIGDPNRSLLHSIGASRHLLCRGGQLTIIYYVDNGGLIRICFRSQLPLDTVVSGHCFCPLLLLFLTISSIQVSGGFISTPSRIVKPTILRWRLLIMSSIFFCVAFIPYCM